MRCKKKSVMPNIFSGIIHKVKRGREKMSKVTIRVDFEELKEAISKLPDDEKEALFFELNPVWGKALQKMEQEALKNLREGKTISLEKVEDEL